MRILFETFIVTALLLAAISYVLAAGTDDQTPAPAASQPAVDQPNVVPINPPYQGYFTKEVIYRGIPIMAPDVVSDAALHEAYRRVSTQLKHLPMITSNIVAAGGQIQIIGKDQVTSDLPEFRDLKGKALAEYNGLTIDQRTRGMGGLHTSVGEENLLKLKNDRYFGRDILTHEFGHCIRNVGMPQNVRDMFNAQYNASLAKGLWVGSYAGSNNNEWFSELSMWYFGTHGDLNMTGPKPENGRKGLKKYDPDAYKLFDDFYNGRIPISQVTPRPRRYRGGGFGQSASGSSGSSSATAGSSSGASSAGASTPGSGAASATSSSAGSTAPGSSSTTAPAGQ